MDLRKRLFAILLSLTMVLTYMPGIAFAAADGSSADGEPAIEETQAPEEDADAVNDADSGGSQAEEQPSEGEDAVSDEVVQEDDVITEDDVEILDDGEVEEVEEVEVTEEEVNGTIMAGSIADNIGDPEDLLMGYFEKEFGAKGSAIKSGMLKARSITRKATLTEYEQSVYNSLYNQLLQLIAGEMTEPVFSYDLPESDSEEYDLRTVIMALSLDCPYEFFWHDKTIGYIYDTYNGFVWFSVAEAYRGDWFEDVTYEDQDGEHDFAVYSLNDRISDAAYAADHARWIESTYQSYSDYKKLNAFKNEICDAVTYDDAAAEDEATPYGDPWQMISVFDQDPDTNVVCEGYSKAFQFLCDNTYFDSPDIECHTVTGQMAGGEGAGGHMWNILHMDDGRNYIADITNSDEGTIGENGSLFLTGALNFNTVNDQFEYDCDDEPDGNRDIVYLYDQDTLDAYSEEELTVSEEDYAAPESTDWWHINRKDTAVDVDVTDASTADLTVLIDSDEVPDGVQLRAEWYPIINDETAEQAEYTDTKSGDTDDLALFDAYDLPLRSGEDEPVQGYYCLISELDGDGDVNRTESIYIYFYTDIPDEPDVEVYDLSFEFGDGREAIDIWEEDGRVEQIEYVDDEPVYYYAYQFLGFNEGDTLTVYESEEDTEGTVYTYDPWGAAFFSSDYSRISLEDLYVSSDQSKEIIWEAGGEGYEFTCTYGGKSFNVPVNIIPPDIDDISYESVDGSRYLTLTYGVDGQWLDGEEGEKYFWFWVGFKEGDKLIITKDGNETEYVYVYHNKIDERAFVNPDDPDDYIMENELKLLHDQSEPWMPEQTLDFPIFYHGLTAKAEIRIEDNPIKSISYEPVQPIELPEGVNLSEIPISDEDGGDTYQAYDFPGFREGDILNININDRIQQYRYEIEDEEGRFYNVNDRNDYIFSEGFSIDNNQSPDELWEVGGSYNFIGEYHSVQFEIPVTIVENPVTAISFSRDGYDADNPIQLAEGRDSWIATDMDDNEYTYYYLTFLDGDVLTVTENGIDTEYVYNSDRSRFVSEDQSKYISDNDVRQVEEQGYADEWQPGEDRSFILSYMGCTTEVNVYINVNPVAEISFVRPELNGEPMQFTEDVDLFFDVDGYYCVPRFKEGDELYVTYTGDSEAVKYTAQADDNGDVYEFTSENAGDHPDTINRDDVGFRDHTGSNYKEGVTEGQVVVEYSNRKAYVDYIVIPNPVQSVEFNRLNEDGDRIETIHLKEGIDGGNVYYEEEDVRVFEYSLFYEVGDQLVVTYSDAPDDPVTYVYGFDDGGEGYFTADGTVPEGQPTVISESDVGQYSYQGPYNVWEAGYNDYIWINYAGKETRQYVQIDPSGISSISFNRAGIASDNPVELIENEDGYLDDGLGVFVYTMEYKEDDYVMVYDSLGTGNKYVFSQDNTFVNVKDENDTIELEQETNQLTGNVWEPGDLHEVIIRYNGVETTVPAVVIQGTTPSDPDVEAFETMVAELPDADDITLEDKAAVQAAQEAYSALTPDQKELVSPASLAKLNAVQVAIAAAEQHQADEAAAAEVTDQINDLPDAGSVTTSDREAIEAAREAYDNLTPAQKELVSIDAVTKLTAVETALVAAEKKEADERAAAAVTDLIDALPGADAVTLDDKSAVQAARAAYDALTPDQKALVDSELVEKLEALEARIAELEGGSEDPVPTKLIWEHDNTEVHGLVGMDFILGYDFYVEGYKIIVVYSDGSTKEYICKDVEEDDGNYYTGYFLNGDTSGNYYEKDICGLKNEEIITNDGVIVEGSDNIVRLALTVDGVTVYSDEFTLIGVIETDPDVEAFEEMVTALPDASSVTTSDKAAIEAARAAYDNLTPAQKELVSLDAVTKLTAVETALVAAEKREADERAAAAVTAQINALPDTVTADNKSAVKAARAAYDALTPDQKDLVDKNSLSTLAAAESDIAKIEANEQISAADTEANMAETAAETSTDSADVAAAQAAAQQAVEMATAAEEAAQAALEAAQAALNDPDATEEQQQIAQANVDVAMQNLATAKVLKAAANVTLAKSKKAAAKVASNKAAAAQEAAENASTSAQAEEYRKQAEAAANEAAALAGEAETASGNAQAAVNELEQMAADNPELDINDAASQASEYAGQASDAATAADTAKEDASSSAGKAKDAATNKKTAEDKAKANDLNKTKPGTVFTVGGFKYKVLKNVAGSAPGTVTLVTAKNAKSVTVPPTVKYNNRTFKVVQIEAKAFAGKKIKNVTIGANVSKIAANAFKGSKATKVILKTKLLKKAGVKKCLKGAKVKTVQVKVGSKKVNKKFVKSYKKIFTKKIAGKKVTVK